MQIELQQGEQVLAVLRKHWLLFALEAVSLVILFFVPFFLSALPFDIPLLSGGTATFFGAIWMLFLLMRGFISWTNYYLDIWIVTNMRLVDVEQIALFNRKASTLELEHIEDITVKIEGFLASMIGYGTVSVQTAANLQEFLINDIQNPEEAKQTIYTAQRLAKHEDQQKIVNPDSEHGI
jgi:hypothetical protein